MSKHKEFRIEISSANRAVFFPNLVSRKRCIFVPFRDIVPKRELTPRSPKRYAFIINGSGSAEVVIQYVATTIGAAFLISRFKIDAWRQGRHMSGYRIAVRARTILVTFLVQFFLPAVGRREMS